MRTTLFCGSFLPPTTESLTVIIRSNGRKPAFSAGPPDMMLMTKIVSVVMLNDMPMPLNEPSNSSLAVSASAGGM